MVKREEVLQETFTLDDGFKYWLPKGFQYGVFSAYQLREIANILDELNYEWQKQIEKEIGIADPR